MQHIFVTSRCVARRDLSRTKRHTMPNLFPKRPCVCHDFHPPFSPSTARGAHGNTLANRPAETEVHVFTRPPFSTERLTTGEIEVAPKGIRARQGFLVVYMPAVRAQDIYRSPCVLTGVIWGFPGPSHIM